MITIEKTPPRIAFAGNPVNFTIKSDKAYAGSDLEGDRAGNHKHYSVIHYEWMTLSEGNGDLRFTLNGFQGRIYATTNPSEAEKSGAIYHESGKFITIKEIFNEIKNWDIFYTLFEINRSINDDNSGVIRFMGKNFEKIELEFEENDIFKKHTVYTSGGVNYTADFRIHRIVQMNDAIRHDYLDTDMYGRSVNSVNTYLQAGFRRDISLPMKEAVHLQNEMCLKYQVRFNEVIGQTSYKYQSPSDTDFYALPGKLTADKYRDSIGHESSAYEGKFLTNYPGVKHIYTDQNEVLSILLDSGEYSLIYTIQTASDVLTKEIPFTVTDGKKIIDVNCHPTFVNDLAKTDCQAFSVKIKKGNLLISDERWFFIDTIRPENVTYIYFINEYGMLELSRWLGNFEMQQTYQRKLTESDSAVCFGVKEEKKCSFYSPYLTGKEWTWLLEFQRSLQLMICQDGDLIPAVNITEETSLNTQKLNFQDIELKLPKHCSWLSSDGLNYIFDTTFDNTFN